MKTVTLTELQNDISKYLELAEGEEIIILREGKPVGLLRGFSDEDDVFDYQLETHPAFIERVRRSRSSFRAGKGIRIEDVKSAIFDDKEEEEE